MNDFLKRVADNTGFIREVRSETENPVVIPFFGDKRHEFFLSVFLHHHFENIIIAGIPGRSSLFPKAAEYWNIKDEGVLTSIAKESIGWTSNSLKAAHIEKKLMKFLDVMSSDELLSFYDFGLKPKFFEKYEFLTVELPSILPLKFDILVRLPIGKKVVLIPNRLVLFNGKLIEVNQRFYITLAERLFQQNIIPIVLQSYGTYDISAVVGGRFPVFSKLSVVEEMGVVRECDCLLDLFSGDSRLAMLAKVPFLVVCERKCYDGLKDYEMEDLVASNLFNKHIFSFVTMIGGNDYGNIIDGILVKLRDFQENKLLDSPSSFVAPYMLVRERKMKKFGFRLVNFNKVE